MHQIKQKMDKIHLQRSKSTKLSTFNEWDITSNDDGAHVAGLLRWSAHVGVKAPICLGICPTKHP